MLVKALRLLKPIRGIVERSLFRTLGMEAYYESLDGCLQGRPLLIVGNGPSLNRTPLDSFTGIPSIGMNKIDMIFARTSWRPSLICCTNGLVMRQNRRCFNSSPIPVLVGMKGFGLGIRGPNVHYFLEKRIGEFSKQPAEGLGLSGTVTYVALQMAYFMQADPIVIVGVDHSFKLEGNTEANAIETRETEDANHFDPNYFAKGMRWGIPNLELSEMGYLRALERFHAADRKIYDATIGGHLQIFPRIPIEEAILMCGGNAGKSR